jgi:fatty-acid desaturase
MALALVGAWEFKKPILFFAGVVAAVLIPHLQDIVNSLGACF